MCVARVVSAHGHVEVARGGDGRILAVRDGLGRRADCRYDAAGRLVEAADLAGETWRFGYEAGRLSAVADPCGANVLRAGYLGDGRVA